MIPQYWSWALAFVGIAGVWLAGNKRLAGWIIGVAVQALWITYALVTWQLGFVASALVYGAVYGRNAVKWWREQQQPEQEAPREVTLTPPAGWTKADIEQLVNTWQGAAARVEREGGTLTVLIEPYNERQLEAHRFSYEGSTSMLARHLVETHGLEQEAVQDYDGGLTQGHWIALDDLHVDAHKGPQELHRRPGDPT